MGFETVLPHPLPSRFSAQSVQNTHIYTHCVNTLFGRRPRRVNRSMLGGAEDGGQTRADRGPGASTPPRTGRPGLALTSQHGPPGREGRFPSPRSSARDPQGVPYEWQGSLKGARAAPTPGPGIRPSPPPQDGSRTLFTPRLRGHRGAVPAARGGGRARTRVRTGRPRRAAPRQDPLRSRARCARRAGAGRPPWAPRRQAPGATAASPGPGPRPGPGSGGD